MFEHGRRRHTDRFGHQDIGREIGREIRRNLLREVFSCTRSGPAVRRGEIRPLILNVLLQKPMHGYEVIQELESQSGGRWRPSAGSVYPTLQLLADEGLVTSEEVDGRRTYTLTDAGRKQAAASARRSPWTEADDDDDRDPDIRQLAMQLAAAVIQVHKMGSPRARQEARRILAEARRQMYRLLSDDEESPAEEDAPSQA